MLRAQKLVLAAALFATASALTTVSKPNLRSDVAQPRSALVPGGAVAVAKPKNDLFAMMCVPHDVNHGARDARVTRHAFRCLLRAFGSGRHRGNVCHPVRPQAGRR